MTNKEIKAICEAMRKKHSEVDWGFRITQTKSEVKIFWGYLDKGTCWKLNIKELYAINEHGEFMNYELEDTTSLQGLIESCVYYMVTRY